MKSMNTPRTRAEFERNFNLLHRQIKDERLNLPIDYGFDSLLRLRFLPNGRIDFLSVDESTRSLANSTAHFNEESFLEQLKEYEAPTDASSGGGVVEPVPDTPDAPPQVG